MKKLFLFLFVIAAMLSCDRNIDEDTTSQMSLMGGYRLINSYFGISNNSQSSANIEWNIEAINFIGSDQNVYGISGSGNHFINSGSFNSQPPSNNYYSYQPVNNYYLPLLADKADRIDVVFSSLQEKTGKECTFEITVLVKGDAGTVLKENNIITGPVSGNHIISLDITNIPDQLDYDIYISIDVYVPPAESRTVTFNGYFKMENKGDPSDFFIEIPQVDILTANSNLSFGYGTEGYADFIDGIYIGNTETFMDNISTSINTDITEINFPLTLNDMDGDNCYEVVVKLLGDNGRLLKQITYPQNPNQAGFMEHIFIEPGVNNSMETNYTIDISVIAYSRRIPFKSLISTNTIINNYSGTNVELNTGFSVSHIEFIRNSLVEETAYVLNTGGFGVNDLLVYKERKTNNNTNSYNLYFPDDCDKVILYFEDISGSPNNLLNVNIYAYSNYLIGTASVTIPPFPIPAIYELPVDLTANTSRYIELLFEITLTAM